MSWLPILTFRVIIHTLVKQLYVFKHLHCSISIFGKLRYYQQPVNVLMYCKYVLYSICVSIL